MSKPLEQHIIDKRPEPVSESTRRRNPHLYGLTPLGEALSKMTSPLRQSTATPTKAEQEWTRILRQQYPDAWVTEQAITFRLANGLRYTPDNVVFGGFTHRFSAYEVKGKRRKDSRWFTDDSKVKIKVAARVFPWVRWAVVWKENGQWQEQVVTT